MNAMNDKEQNGMEIYSKILRAGRRKYFFDVRETRAGDYYLTITESKRSANEDGSFYFKKHKIFLYKEDFEGFKENLEDATNFIINEKGGEVISEKHQSDFHVSANNVKNEVAEVKKETENLGDKESFTNLKFEDI